MSEWRVSLCLVFLFVTHAVTTFEYDYDYTEEPETREDNHSSSTPDPPQNGSLPVESEFGHNNSDSWRAVQAILRDLGLTVGMQESAVTFTTSTDDSVFSSTYHGNPVLTTSGTSSHEYQHMAVTTTSPDHVQAIQHLPTILTSSSAHREETTERLHRSFSDNIATFSTQEPQTDTLQHYHNERTEDTTSVSTQEPQTDTLQHHHDERTEDTTSVSTQEPQTDTLQHHHDERTEDTTSVSTQESQTDTLQHHHDERTEDTTSVSTQEPQTDTLQHYHDERTEDTTSVSTQEPQTDTLQHHHDERTEDTTSVSTQEPQTDTRQHHHDERTEDTTSVSTQNEPQTDTLQHHHGERTEDTTSVSTQEPQTDALQYHHGEHLEDTTSVRTPELLISTTQVHQHQFVEFIDPASTHSTVHESSRSESIDTILAYLETLKSTDAIRLSDNKVTYLPNVEFLASSQSVFESLSQFSHQNLLTTSVHDVAYLRLAEATSSENPRMSIEHRISTSEPEHRIFTSEPSSEVSQEATVNHPEDFSPHVLLESSSNVATVAGTAHRRSLFVLASSSSTLNHADLTWDKLNTETASTIIVDINNSSDYSSHEESSTFSAASLLHSRSFSSDLITLAPSMFSIISAPIFLASRDFITGTSQTAFLWQKETSISLSEHSFSSLEVIKNLLQSSTIVLLSTIQQVVPSRSLNDTLRLEETSITSSHSEIVMTGTYTTSDHDETYITGTYTTSSHFETDITGTHASSSQAETDITRIHTTFSYNETDITGTHTTSSYDEIDETGTHTTSDYAETDITRTHTTSSHDIIDIFGTPTISIMDIIESHAISMRDRSVPHTFSINDTLAIKVTHTFTLSDTFTMHITETRATFTDDTVLATETYTRSMYGTTYIKESDISSTYDIAPTSTTSEESLNESPVLKFVESLSSTTESLQPSSVYLPTVFLAPLGTEITHQHTILESHSVAPTATAILRLSSSDLIVNSTGTSFTLDLIQAQITSSQFHEESVLHSLHDIITSVRTSDSDIGHIVSPTTLPPSFPEPSSVVHFVTSLLLTLTPSSSTIHNITTTTSSTTSPSVILSDFDIFIIFDGDCIKISEKRYSGILKAKLILFFHNIPHFEIKDNIEVGPVLCNPNKIKIIFKNFDKKVLFRFLNNTFHCDCCDCYDKNIRIHSMFLNLTGFHEVPETSQRLTNNEITPGDITVIAIASCLCVVLVLTGTIIFAREVYRKSASKRFIDHRSSRTRLRAESVALTKIPIQSLDNTDTEMNEESCVNEAFNNSIDDDNSRLSSENKTSFPSSEQNSPGLNLNGKQRNKQNKQITKENFDSTKSESNGINTKESKGYGLIIGLMGYAKKPENQDKQDLQNYHSKRHVDDIPDCAVPQKGSKSSKLPSLSATEESTKPSLSHSKHSSAESTTIDESSLTHGRRQRNLPKYKGGVNFNKKLLSSKYNLEENAPYSRSQGGIDNLVFSDECVDAEEVSTQVFRL